jgi:hypothetical protein
MSKTKLNPKLVEEIARTAVQTALEHIDKEKSRQEKAKRDRRLRNVKLLLKNYRSFKLHCEDIPLELEELEHPDDVLEELNADELAIESIKRSKERTLVMVKFIDQMILVFRIVCEQSKRPEEIRRFKTIEMMYISDEEYTAKEIATCHKIDTRTVYRDINEASKTLSVLMFGVDGVKFVK